MPVTAFQKDVLRLLAHNRNDESYLAGATAMLIQPNTLRYSHDIDFFHDREELVHQAFESDKYCLVGNGYVVDVFLETVGFIRARIARNKHSVLIDWAHDSAWRFLPLFRDTEYGYFLHPLDNAINKVLALVGRDEPRDVLDTLYAHEHILSLGALVWAACGKDPGLTPELILSMLRRRGRLHPEQLEQLDLATTLSLPELKHAWLAAFEQAETFVAACEPDKIGCLYYDTKTDNFVTPQQPAPDNVVPHYGRPGGVLPRPSHQGC